MAIRDAGAMTLVDEMQGAYIVAHRASFRLWLEGGLYASDDVIQGMESRFQNLQARDYVIDHLTRRLGANRDKWPPAARFFLAEAKTYDITADPEGRLVALPAAGAIGSRSRLDRHEPTRL